MQLFKVDKIWSASDNYFPIIFLGDCHVGSPQCDYKMLQEDVEEIAKMQNAMIFLMGDQAEYIDMHDKRFRPSQIDKRFLPRLEDLPVAYIEYLTDLFTPIAHMIEVVHDGNHENSMFPTMFPGAELCARLREKVASAYGGTFAQNKLRYAPGEAYTKIIWKQGNGGHYRSTLVNTAHGWQAGRQPGAKHNEMSKMFSWIGADIIFRGHSHELFAAPGPPRETPNQEMTKLKTVSTIYGNTGSYLKTREVSQRPSYSELAGYRPIERGHVQVHIELDDKGLRKSIHIK